MLPNTLNIVFEAGGSRRASGDSCNLLVRGGHDKGDVEWRGMGAHRSGFKKLESIQTIQSIKVGGIGYVENNGLITPRQKFWAERLEEAGTGFALQQQQQLRPEDLLSLPTDAAAARCHCPCSRGVS